MTSSKHRSASASLAIVAAAFALLPAASASAQAINGLKEMPRVFNDFSTSTLNFTTNNANPGSTIIDDRNMLDDGAGGNFANRHDVLVSSDGGTTARTFSIDQGFTFSTNLNLAVGSVSPRKEAGIRITSPVTGDALFLVNSDAGEIVAFGGGAPFFSFSSGAQPDYTPGTTMQLGITYRPGSPSTTGGTPATIEYFIDRDIASPAGFSTSGPLAFSNLEGGPVSFNLGVYAQVAPASANDFITANFSQITTVIPEPATLLASLATLGGLVRRSRR